MKYPVTIPSDVLSKRLFASGGVVNHTTPTEEVYKASYITKDGDLILGTRTYPDAESAKHTKGNYRRKEQNIVEEGPIIKVVRSTTVEVTAVVKVAEEQFEKAEVDAPETETEQKEA